VMLFSRGNCFAVVKIVDKSYSCMLNASCESLRSGTANLFGRNNILQICDLVLLFHRVVVYFRMTFECLDFVVMVHSCKSHLSLTQSIQFFSVCYHTNRSSRDFRSCFLEENVGLWEYEERFIGTVTKNTAWAY